MKSGEDVYKISYRAHGTDGNAKPVTRAIVSGAGKKEPGTRYTVSAAKAGRSSLKKVFHFDSPQNRYPCDAAIEELIN
jgi:hypothetical protein